MPKYDEFKSMTMGKGYDIDGFYGNQRWDGYAKYCQFLGVPVTHCQPSGYVKSIWEERKKNGILKSFDEVEKLQPGDVVIFKEHPATPLSHVALFDHDAGGNGTVTRLLKDVRQLPIHEAVMEIEKPELRS